MDELRGIKDLIPFLAFLAEKKIHHIIEQDRPSSVMVTIRLFGIFIELDFFDDHIEYSYFTGNEDVETDQARLFAMIQEFITDRHR